MENQNFITENEVLLCMEWLKKQKITKTMDKSSYGLKNIVERAYNKYISNDSFIEAVKRLGIPYKKVDNSINILVGISNKLVP